MKTNEFNGQLLGSIEEVFGENLAVEIDENDFYSKNVTLIINKGKDNILCSAKLSNLIRERNLDRKIEELKKFAVYRFEDGEIYAISSINSNLFQDKEEEKNKLKSVFMEHFSEYLELLNSGKLTIKELTEVEKTHRERELEFKKEIDKINSEY